MLICHLRLLQYTGMPFGLIKAPTNFLQFINQFFSGKEWTFTYSTAHM